MSKASSRSADVLLLRATSRRMSPTPPLLRGPDNLAPCLTGMLALARRRAARTIRIRSLATGGTATFGREARAYLSETGTAECFRALRDAARLDAASRYCLGWFFWRGDRVGVEIYRCHDGEKCLVHVGESASSADTEAPRGKAVFGELLCSFIEGLDALHGGALAPEDLLAIRLSSEAGDLGELLERHCDLTLVALACGAPSGPGLASRLASALGQVLALGCVEAGGGALAECHRLVRTTTSPVVAERVGDIVRLAMAAAPPGLRAGLRSALSHGL